MLCHAGSCCVMLCHAGSCCVMLGHVYHAVSCWVMLCRTVFRTSRHVGQLLRSGQRKVQRVASESPEVQKPFAPVSWGADTPGSSSQMHTYAHTSGWAGSCEQLPRHADAMCDVRMTLVECHAASSGTIQSRYRACHAMLKGTML